MTTEPFTDAAEDRADELWPYAPAGIPLSPAKRMDRRVGFRLGAQWAHDYLTAQEPTDAEQAARFAVESKHHLHGTQCLCGFESHQARSRTEHIMTHYFDELSAARAALSAARAARRDEEAR